MIILLIDDEESDCKLASRILTHEGHSILEARSAEEALVLLGRTQSGSRPQVILTDLVLPDMDGLALTRRLKADPATASIPVAAMSSHLATFPPDDLDGAGFSLILTKPVSGRTLPRQIAALDTLDTLDAPKESERAEGKTPPAP